MSEYDGCPDPNCDGCEGTEPYFLGKLPPAPPFVRTDEEMKAALDKVWEKYPNVRISSVAVITMMIQGLGIQPTQFKAAEDRCYDYLAAEKRKGAINVLKGKSGGLMRNHVGPLERAELRALDKQVDQLVSSMPAINNHVCPHCKNDKVSKTESSCWKCGGAL